MEDEDFIMEEPEWDKINAEIHAEEQEQERKDKAILEQVKQQVSPTIYQQIQSEIEESGYTHDYRIVDAPKGDFQDRSNEYDDYFLNMWVDQYSGYFGDDFHGTVDIELSEGKYLRWSFSM
jgi:hypothetical protein